MDDDGGVLAGHHEQPHRPEPAANEPAANEPAANEPAANEPWVESWWFGFETIDVAGFVELTLVPALGRAWYRCALARTGHPLLLIEETDAPMPRVGLELKAYGLWADHVCEEPMAQWTVLNEAYAVALDDPDDALDRALGTPTPLAFDLEWYATGTARAHHPETGPFETSVVPASGARGGTETSG